MTAISLYKERKTNNEWYVENEKLSQKPELLFICLLFHRLKPEDIIKKRCKKDFADTRVLTNVPEDCMSLKRKLIPTRLLFSI